MSRGIIFYNSGTKCLPRLLVSVHSLRQHYEGNICIISSGDESRQFCAEVAIKYKCVYKEFSSDITHMKNHFWFEKSRMHLYSPYDTTIFIDSDTLTIKDPSDLFKISEEHEFAVPQFADWTTQKGLIKKRLLPWKEFDEHLVNTAINTNMKSVNVGVYGFVKQSELMKNWFDFTKQMPEAVLPEESSCHLLLNKYKGLIVDRGYNCSCKFDDPNRPNTRIIHYHGRKHCRKHPVTGEFMFNASSWAETWKPLLRDNVCNVSSIYKVCGDKHLEKLYAK